MRTVMARGGAAWVENAAFPEQRSEDQMRPAEKALDTLHQCHPRGREAAQSSKQLLSFDGFRSGIIR